MPNFIDNLYINGVLNTDTNNTIYQNVTTTTGTASTGVSNTALLSNAGISVVTCSSASTAVLNYYTLSAPAAGVTKTLCVISTGSSGYGVQVATTSKSITIGDATNNAVKFATTGVDQSVVLRGISTTRWAIVANTGSALTTVSS